MSRRGLAIATCVLAPALMAQAAPADDTPEQITAEEALEDYQEVYGPPEPEPEVSFDCDEPVGDEIVVCAALEEQSQFRVPSSLDEGDDSHLAYEGRPPDLFGLPDHGPVVARGCFIPPCPPPPVYYFDITALPEPPPGSDADKIAKGEKPAG